MGQPIRRRQHAHSADSFWDLVATAKRLQAPGGCPWDRAQTVDSLLPYLIEETWEVFEAVRSRRRHGLTEELGDVLYCVLFLALVAERSGGSSLQTLLRGTRQKMIRRHPHVFGAKSAATPREAYRHWQRSKRLEGPARHSPSKALRERLVADWDRLAVSGRRSRRSRARPEPPRGQSPSRARDSLRVGRRQET